MPNILHIESSSLHEGSLTREIGAYALAHLMKKYPDATVTQRDLIQVPISHVNEEFVRAIRAPDNPTRPPDPALKFSDAMVNELMAMDILLLEAPMYNFSIPSVLKAWIDHIVRPGRTFKYADGKGIGLVHGKKAIIIFGRGGVYTQGPMKPMDYQEPYLRAIFGFMGIIDVASVYIEGSGYGPEAAAKAIQQAKATIDQI